MFQSREYMITIGTPCCIFIDANHALITSITCCDDERCRPKRWTLDYTCVYVGKCWYLSSKFGRMSATNIEVGLVSVSASYVSFTTLLNVSMKCRDVTRCRVTRPAARLQSTPVPTSTGMPKYVRGHVLTSLNYRNYCRQIKELLCLAFR